MLDLHKGGFHDLGLTGLRELSGHFLGEEAEKMREVEERLEGEALQEVKLDLVNRVIVAAVGQEALEELSVELLAVSGGLGVVLRILAELGARLAESDPSSSEVIEDVSMLRLAQEAWVEHRQDLNETHPKEVVLKSISSFVTS